MTIYQGAATVGTVATQLNLPRTMPGVIHIVNNDNTDTVYVGGSAITTSTGHRILKGEHTDIQIYANDIMYAISNKTGHTVTWLHVTS